MEKIGNFVMRFKYWIIALVILLTVFFVMGFKYLTIDSDFAHSYSPDDPDVKLLNYAGEKFGSNYIAMVGLQGKNIFTYKTLTRIKKLSEKFGEIKGVNSVTSLLNVMDIRKTGDGIEVDDLFPDIPKDQAQLNQKRKYVLNNDMYAGKIVSKDGTSTIIMVKLRDNADKIAVSKAIYKIVKENPGNEKIYYSGFPLVMEYTARMIQKDMKTLVPITFLVVIITLFLSFGSLRGVFLPLTVVLIAVIWVFGLMGWIGKPIGIVSNTIPIILLATGTAYGIHFLNKYNELISGGANKNNAIIKTFKTTGIPIIMAGVTTFVGFISMVTASLTFVKDFGVFSAIGIVFSLILTLILVPPLLSFLKPLKSKKKGGHAPVWLQKGVESIGMFVLKHEKGIIITGVVISVVSLFFIPKLTTDVNQINYYPKDSPPRQAEYFMEKEFGGSTPFGVMFISKDDDGIKNPFVLKQISKFIKEMRVVPHSKNVQGISTLIEEINYKMNGVKGIPDTVDKVGNLWFFIEGKSGLENMITSDNKETLIQGFIDDMDSKVIANIVKETKNNLNSIIDPIYPFKRDNLLKAGDTNRNIIVNYVLNEIKENFNLDIKFFKERKNLNIGYPNDNFWKKVKSYLLDNNKLPDNFTDIAKKAVDKYLASDEVEIELNDKDRQKVEEQIKLIISGDKELLTEKLQKKLSGQDPDDIADLASSLVDLVNNKIMWYRAEDLLSQLLWIKNLNDDEIATLRGDLWDINAQYWGLPKKIISPLMGTVQVKPVKFVKEQASMAVVMDKMRVDLLYNMGSSVALAMILVLILLTIQLKSFVGGLFSLTAIVFALLVNFLIMAISGIPLDTGTVLFGSIAIGIGIDYTIHFITRLKEEVKSGKDEKEAIKTTLDTTGVGIVINTITVALGFMVLLVSEMVPLQRLGLLVALTMFWSALGAITLYPAVILGLKLKFLRK